MAANRTPGGARSNAAILGQVGITVAVPIVLGAWLGLKLDEQAGTSPWGLLGAIFLGMIAAGGGVALLIKRFAEDNPVGPVTDAARAAGRAWQAETLEREKRAERGEES